MYKCSNQNSHNVTYDCKNKFIVNRVVKTQFCYDCKRFNLIVLLKNFNLFNLVKRRSGSVMGWLYSVYMRKHRRGNMTLNGDEDLAMASSAAETVIPPLCVAPWGTRRNAHRACLCYRSTPRYVGHELIWIYLFAIVCTVIATNIESSDIVVK